MGRLYLAIGALVAGLVLVVVGILVPASLAFKLGVMVCCVAYLILGTRRGAFRRTFSTPDMSDLVSDVREHDRALRDGMWVEEFAMRDDGPRRIIGSIALVVFGLFLIQPAFYLLVRFADGAPIATAITVVGAAAGLAALLYETSAD